jgi:cyclophilin family peptidyl-prolyl cis-trans isomerase
MHARYLACLMLLGIASHAPAVPADIVGPLPPPVSNRVIVETSHGTMLIELYPDKAPRTVANFLGYVQSGFYDKTLFHRVIPNFMIQGGGFDADFKEKPAGKPVVNEAASAPLNERGTLAVARTVNPDSGTCQFFINLRDNPQLNAGQGPPGAGYCVFGRIIEGMEVADKIAGVKTGARGVHQNVPDDDVIIKSVRVVK